jgi:YbgC/YbaW family acyl-CoA thioester hydrolase
MIFTYRTKVRMYDTDTAQILFFGNQYRFMNDALEDLLAEEGLTMHHLFHSGINFGFVVVHSEANYLAPLHAGDRVKISVTVSRIGSTSFEFSYELYRDETQVGTGKTVHVVIDHKTHKKKQIPDSVRLSLQKYCTVS